MKTLPPIAINGQARPVINSTAVDPELIDDTGIRSCVDYWETKRGEQFAPRWSDFRLYELPAKVLPYVLVLDVKGEPPTFWYRYWGSGHTQYHQHDYTGKKTTDMADTWSATLLTNQYMTVMEARRPLVFINTYEGVENPLRSL